jgi:ABC-2 type transport system ATP-binding protein
VDFAVTATRLQSHLKKDARELSGGLKRRLNLAIGLLNSPGILILDEPTVGIDPQSRHFILETISRLTSERDMTVIYTSHYMEEVEQICEACASVPGRQ